MMHALLIQVELETANSRVMSSGESSGVSRGVSRYPATIVKLGHKADEFKVKSKNDLYPRRHDACFILPRVRIHIQALATST